MAIKNTRRGADITTAAPAPPAASYVTTFDHPDGATLSLVGGKGANLGRLTTAGFPVPPGFTVTTAAFKATLSGKVGEQIKKMAATIDYGNAAQLDQKAAAIRKLIEAAPLPADIEQAITKHYKALGAEFVAVRSSGTAEDLAEASFAGQHDTYLDIRGADAVVDAVRRCWASMWTARATSYRHAHGFAHDQASLAVVVQTMVESEVSGVMFTANPMTGNTEETVINASWGLGEAIVSGIVTPDQYTVLVERDIIREKIIGAKEKQCIRNTETRQGKIGRAHV